MTSAKQFVRIWQESNSNQEVACRLGVTESASSVRARRYRKKGIELKKFQGGRTLDLTELRREALKLAVSENSQTVGEFK